MWAKRKTTSHDDKMIIRNTVKSPWKTPCFKEDCKEAHKKQLLTTKTKKKRLQWAKKYRSWGTDQWEKVIFSDKTHFEVCGYHLWYVRRSIGELLREAQIQQAPKHPPKKIFWSFFTVFGPGSLIIIKKMINSDKYKDILANYLLPILSNSDCQAGRVFHQDFALCHISKKMQTFFSQTGITLLDWPGYSLDLNPIENLWAIIKRNFLNMTFLQKYCSLKQ